MQSSNLTSAYISKGREIIISKRQLCFRAHGSVIHNSTGYGSTSVSVDRWMDTENVECRHNETFLSLSHATARMNVEDTMQTEISQTQKDEHCVVSLISGI